MKARWLSAVCPSELQLDPSCACAVPADGCRYTSERGFIRAIPADLHGERPPRVHVRLEAVSTHANAIEDLAVGLGDHLYHGSGGALDHELRKPRHRPPPVVVV